MTDSDPQLSEGLVDAALRLAGIGRDVTDDLTPEQLRASARAWHEIAELVEQAATDEEVATVARATVYRDLYNETTYLRVQVAECQEWRLRAEVEIRQLEGEVERLREELAEARTVTDEMVERAHTAWLLVPPNAYGEVSGFAKMRAALSAVLSPAPVEGGER